MMRRIATAVLYAVVSVVGAGNASAFDSSADDDGLDDGNGGGGLGGVLAFIARDAAERADDNDGDDDASSEGGQCTPGEAGSGGGGTSHSGHVMGEAILDHVSRACGTPVDAAWVARDRKGRSAAVAVQTDPHASKAFVNAALTTPSVSTVKGGDNVPSLLRLPLTRALSHCRDRGYLKVTLAVDGAAVASLQSWVEGRGFQFSRATWVDGAPAAEFYTDLYWSRGVVKADA